MCLVQIAVCLATSLELKGPLTWESIWEFLFFTVRSERTLISISSIIFEVGSTVGIQRACHWRDALVWPNQLSWRFLILTNSHLWRDWKTILDLHLGFYKWKEEASVYLKESNPTTEGPSGFGLLKHQNYESSLLHETCLECFVRISIFMG